jgi:hypothetical protein
MNAIGETRRHSLLDRLIEPRQQIPEERKRFSNHDLKTLIVPIIYASIFSTVICRVILSILFGEVMGMGVIGITWAMIADWAIHAVLIALRYRSGKWKMFQVI